MSNSENSFDASEYDLTQAKLTFGEKLAYGAGDLGTSITTNLLSFFLLFFFTNVAGLDPALAGLVLLIGKIFDAINDPIIGVLSDRTKSKMGRRLPWMIYSAIPFGLTFLAQWIVPSTDKMTLFWYYAIVSIIFNTFFTAVNLPYTALTPEITQDYNERTSLNTFRFTFSIGGSIVSLIIAQIIFAFFKDPARQTGSCNTGGMQYIVLGAVCAIISTISIYWCVLGIKKRAIASDRHRLQNTSMIDETEEMSFVEQLKVVFNNRPFLFVIGIYFCSWLALQITASIIPYFVVNWMKMQESDFILVTIAVQGTALVMLSVWSAISKRFGKKAAYFMGSGIWIIAQAGLFFLQEGQVVLLYVLAIMAGAGVSTAYLIPWSMIPDVTDLDELETGQRREGIFYAFMVLLQKFGLAGGLFLLGIGLSWAQFKESVACQPLPVQPESALFAIRVAIGPLPTIALIIGLVLAYFYPITREVHTEILMRLSEKRRQG
ncbi:MFS transporter [Pseudanabaena sp. FACHB-1998]|uniref:MFS transporter n=1 Tax=Pseudanabaena sp. FACHB-1998 TaxID=2692858 RepID=UPI0016817A49|nr:MFS transporter [Pseudanabaena sp. FACHB-1998]MBD2178876.1 MFS transporter [Pseudanabaena sp. FACHB-1998]